MMATSGRYRGNEEAEFRALGSGADPTSGNDQELARLLHQHGIVICPLEGTLSSGLDHPTPGSAMRFLGLGPNGETGCDGATPNADAVIFANDHVTTDIDLSNPAGSSAQLSRLRDEALRSEAIFLEALIRGLLAKQVPNVRVMLIVLAVSPSVTMNARGDEVTPLLMAKGRPDDLFSSTGPIRSLRSDTTRQDGLVANVDIAPTILDFFGIPIPDEMTGSPIRIDGTADVAHLHQLHLDQRRIRLPLQLGEVAFVAFLGIVAIPMLIWLALGRALPSWMSGSMRFLCLCAVALLVPLMAGGLLPRLTYAVVVPFVVLSTIGLAALAQAARWRSPVGPFVFLSGATLTFIVVDALFGWRGMRLPLIGGTMFDGVRFYGLSNAFIAALLAATLFLAVRLEPRAGASLLFGVGLFAGFPALGANLGAAVTLFVAAGAWWVVRTRPRQGVRELLFVAGVVAVGTAAVFLANRYLPGAPTHITGFVERTRGGLASVWDVFRRRLDVGVGQIRDAPAACIPLIGLPVILATAILRPEPIRAGLDLAGTAWRHALIVLTLAAVASFFANDTGVAAAAPAFLYAATGMAYPAFLVARER